MNSAIFEVNKHLKMLKVDLHAHATSLPIGRYNLGKAGLRANNSWIWNSGSNKNIVNSILSLIGVKSFFQSNLSAAVKGDVKVLGVSIYVPEVFYIKNKLPQKFYNGRDVMVNSYGENSIHKVESGTYDYFRELRKHYDFLKNLEYAQEGVTRFKIAKSFSHLQVDLEESTSDISVVLCIEGAHALGCGYPEFFKHQPSPRQVDHVLQNIEKIKKWEHPVLYITLCHHFYNQICGHVNIHHQDIDETSDMLYGMDFPISDFGYKVIDKLLRWENGRRMLIDIHHMSTSGRQKYYDYLNKLIEKEENYVPVVCSHSAPNGRASYGVDPDEVSNPYLNPGDAGLFDMDILTIASTNGIIGLQLDQQMITNPKFLKKTMRKSLLATNAQKRKIWARLLWENIKYIAELLSENGYPPWDFITIGSNFDGSIKPLRKFENVTELDSLAHCINLRIKEYLESVECRLPLKYQTSSVDILEKLMNGNAMRFMKENLV